MWLYSQRRLFTLTSFPLLEGALVVADLADIEVAEVRIGVDEDRRAPFEG